MLIHQIAVAMLAFSGGEREVGCMRHTLKNEDRTFKVQGIKASCVLPVTRKAVVTWPVLKNSDGM